MTTPTIVSIETHIIENLMSNPAMVYMHPSGHDLFVVVEGRMYHLHTEDDLSEMDEIGLNSWIQSRL